MSEIKLSNLQKLEAYKYAKDHMLKYPNVPYVCPSIESWLVRNNLCDSVHGVSCNDLMATFPEWFVQRPEWVKGESEAWWDDDDPARLEAIDRAITLVMNQIKKEAGYEQANS